MLKKNKHPGKLLLVATGTSLLMACGGSGSDTPSAPASEASTYSGPGSKWDVTLNTDNSFDITRRETPVSDIDMTVAGIYTRHDSGFLTMEVQSASGIDAPSEGETAWALEVPGYALLLKPVASDQIVAMVTSGTCPTSDILANWVIVKQRVGADASNSGTDYIGTFAYDVETLSPSLPSKRSLTAGYPYITEGGIDGSGVCEDGLLLVGDAPDIAAMYLTENGGAIVQTNINNESEASFIFALQADAIEGAALDGDYAGMLFDDNMSDGTKINAVSMTCSSGVCTALLVTDIPTGATSSDGATLTLTGTLEENFITGTIQDSDANMANIACMADQDANGSGKTIVSCVGQSPGDNTKMFNVLFVSL